MNAQVGGKLAQIGARLIDGVAAKMAEDFFVKFNQIVGGPNPGTSGAGAVDVSATAEAATNVVAAEPSAAAQPQPPVTGGIPSWLWITGLIVIVCAATVLILRS